MKTKIIKDQILETIIKDLTTKINLAIIAEMKTKKTLIEKIAS